MKFRGLTCFGSPLIQFDQYQVMDQVLSQLNNFIPFSEYDGKKSMSAVGKNRKEKIDHYTVVSRGKFLDIFMPKDGTGGQLAYELHQVLKNYLATNSLIYIGSDSTGSNTGW